MKNCSLQQQIKLTCKIVDTILWICIAVACFLPDWGGHKLAGHYQVVSFFDASAWLFGVIVVICSIIAIIVLWTKLYKVMLAVSCVQTLLLIISYVGFESHGSVYELGLAHLIMVITALIIAVLLSCNFFKFIREKDGE